jgi:hypothetical protein
MAEREERDDETFFSGSPDLEVPDQPVGTAAEAAVAHEDRPAPPEQPVAPSPLRGFRPASAEAVKQAIDDVMQILASLRESSDKMDEVLEILEEAERQQTADEREIDALRQQLRRFHRPAEEVVRPPKTPPGDAPNQGHPQHGGHRNPQRRHRDQRDQRGSPRGPRDPRDRDRDRGDTRSHRGHEPHRDASSATGRAEPPAAAPHPADPSGAPADPPTPPDHGFEPGDPS